MSDIIFKLLWKLSGGPTTKCPECGVGQPFHNKTCLFEIEAKEVQERLKPYYDKLDVEDGQ